MKHIVINVGFIAFVIALLFHDGSVTPFNYIVEAGLALILIVSFKIQWKEFRWMAGIAIPYMLGFPPSLQTYITGLGCAFVWYFIDHEINN